MIIPLIYFHIGSAFGSLALLLIRGSMQLSGKDWRSKKLLKILPHLVDSILIGTGLFIFFSYGYSSAGALWIWAGAKIACLIGYIIFSAKFFSKKQVQPKPIFFGLASLCLLAAIYLGYSLS